MPKQKGTKPSSALSTDSIRTMADAAGVSDLQDDAVSWLAEDTTFRLQKIVQEAAKFMRHGKRRKLSTSDIDSSLRSMNATPVYGISWREEVPFRLASGGGREIFFTDDPEVDLADQLTSSLPKVPHDTAIRAHWLSIDGRQPSVPENPPPVERDTQRQEALTRAAMQPDAPRHTAKATQRQRHAALVKQPAVHELSMEQQLYYKEITEACVGSSEEKRIEALSSLSQDPGLYHLVPRFSCFIAEGVRVNIGQKNLALLIYLMRMVKALLDNKSLYLERYMHEIHPAVLSCVVSRQLCLRPEQDNHWALRDFASRVTGAICRQFSNSINSLQPRTTKLLSDILSDVERPLATHYGCVTAINEFGPEAVKLFILPQAPVMGSRIQTVMEGHVMNPADRVAADNLKTQLLRVLPGAVKSARPAPDVEEEYLRDFGSVLGKPLCTHVAKLRTSLGGGAAPSRPFIAIPQAGSSRVMMLSPSTAPRIMTTGATMIAPRTTSTPSTPITAAPHKQQLIIVRSDSTPSINQKKVVVLKGSQEIKTEEDMDL